MGTPHVGTDAANWASIFVSLIEASTFGTVTNTPLLNGLKQNSELLTKICRQFTGRVSGLRVLTFYETLKCKGLNRLVSLTRVNVFALNIISIRAPLTGSIDCNARLRITES